MSDFISQRVEISHNDFVFGRLNLINNDKLDFKTSITLALPSDQSEYKEGNFEIISEGRQINIQISKILNQTQDPIFSLINNFKEIEAFHKDITKMHLPIEMYTDNKGDYPYYCARISFPYLLAGWINKKYDYDREQITGGYKDKDKVEALFALNKLFENIHYGLRKKLVYEDIILFIEDYLLGNKSIPRTGRVCTFASKNAFKDAVASFLGSNGNNYIAEIVERQSHLDTYPDIQTENDLLEFIVHSIEDNIIHYIENQYIITAFWNNGDEKTHYDKPKSEVDIQSILYFLMELSVLKSEGIEIVKEPDKGIGKPDFVFVYRTSAGKTLHIPLEFKLAHNKRIEHGITRQLPAYMKADKTTCGIYAVMWFKDEDGKVFKEPINRTKTGMIEFTREKAKEINEKEGLNIRTLFIDASVRKSASKL